MDRGTKAAGWSIVATQDFAESLRQQTGNLFMIIAFKFLLILFAFIIADGLTGAVSKHDRSIVDDIIAFDHSSIKSALRRFDLYKHSQNFGQ